MLSRRDGLSPRSLEFYQCYLGHASSVVGLHVKGQDIGRFIDSLGCTNGGKHAYYRALRAFYNWAFSRKSGFGLDAQDNPILIVEAPKVGKRILPSMTPEQLDYLMEQANNTRDKAIISLFADSGLRLSELARISPQNIDWEHHLISAICKGNKEGYAAFGSRTEALLKEWIAQRSPSDKLWDINASGISIMLRRLGARTGLPCNPHTFRRTFASVLSKRGLDSLHIMRLGRWESVQMVERYTRSVKFDDSLRLYSSIVD